MTGTPACHGEAGFAEAEHKHHRRFELAEHARRLCGFSGGHRLGRIECRDNGVHGGVGLRGGHIVVRGDGVVGHVGHVRAHRSFRVDRPISTSIMVMTQKRTTTCVSFQPDSSK